MHHRFRLLAVAIATVVALGIATTSATANRSLTVNGGGRALTGTSPELRFTGSNGLVVSCNVTINGSVHSSIAKTRGTLAGYITEARTSGCKNNLGITPTTAIPLLATPWHVLYLSFTGTLPRITGELVELIGAAYLFRVENLSCLFQGNVPTAVSGTTGAAELTIETLTLLTNVFSLRTSSGEELFRRCPETGEISGTAATGTNITVRLI